MAQAETLTEPASKQELLAQIDAEFAALRELVESIPPEELLVPLVDALSIKDLIAHIYDWQHYVLRRIRSAAIGEQLPYRVPPGGGYDRINAEIYELHRDRPWEDVWGDFVRDVADLRSEIEQMSEEDLFSHERVLAVMGAPEGRAIGYLYGNTSEHYREHADEIRARRAG